MDVRPDPRLPSPEIAKKCHKGRRTVCTTKYHTECTTQQVQQTMQEDYPKCQVEMVEKCPEHNQVSTSSNRFDKCRRVPAMRCKIEKRTVVKTKPESKCSRVPRQFCRKEDCDENAEDEDTNNCYYRNQVVNEVVPEEKCSLIPKQMCHSVTEPAAAAAGTERRLKKRATSEGPLAFLRRHYLNRHRQKTPTLPRRSRNFIGGGKVRQQVCKTVPEQICEKKRVNPRVVEKEMLKKFCREPRSYYDRILVAKLKQRQESTYDP